MKGISTLPPSLSSWLRGKKASTGNRNPTDTNANNLIVFLKENRRYVTQKYPFPTR